MKTQIPIYRAKRIDNGEFIEGNLGQYNNGKYWINPHLPNGKQCFAKSGRLPTDIDPSTLAIHFPDMLDKNNKPIFASLSEDGNGGDIIKDVVDNYYYVLVDEFYFIIRDIKERFDMDLEIPKEWYEVTGIYIKDGGDD